MFSLFTSRSSTLANAATPSGAGARNLDTDNSVAHQLLERADSGAGRDPHRAQELRDAARAFLSVVR
jgi:hypothetical protein